MKVYCVLEKKVQRDFANPTGNKAKDAVRLIDIYASKRSADHEAYRLQEYAHHKYVKYGCDQKTYYYILEKEIK